MKGMIACFFERQTKINSLFILLCLLSILSPAHADCLPEAAKALAKLQNSAKTEPDVDKWFAQIVCEGCDFYEGGTISGKEYTGTEIVHKNLWAAMFPNRHYLIFLKHYLSDFKINLSTKNAGKESQAEIEYKLNGEVYTYYFQPLILRKLCTIPGFCYNTLT